MSTGPGPRRFSRKVETEIGWIYPSEKAQSQGKLRVSRITAIKEWEDLSVLLREAVLAELATGAESAAAAAQRTEYLGRDKLADDWRVKAHVARLAAKALTVKP